MVHFQGFLGNTFSTNQAIFDNDLAEDAATAYALWKRVNPNNSNQWG